MNGGQRSVILPTTTTTTSVSNLSQEYYTALCYSEKKPPEMQKNEYTEQKDAIN